MFYSQKKREVVVDIVSNEKVFKEVGSKKWPELKDPKSNHISVHISHLIPHHILIARSAGIHEEELASDQKYFLSHQALRECTALVFFQYCAGVYFSDLFWNQFSLKEKGEDQEISLDALAPLFSSFPTSSFYAKLIKLMPIYEEQYLFQLCNTNWSSPLYFEIFKERIYPMIRTFDFEYASTSDNPSSIGVDNLITRLLNVCKESVVVAVSFHLQNN